jgi:hypothetical protein
MFRRAAGLHVVARPRRPAVGRPRSTGGGVYLRPGPRRHARSQTARRIQRHPAGCSSSSGIRLLPRMSIGLLTVVMVSGVAGAVANADASPLTTALRVRGLSRWHNPLSCQQQVVPAWCFVPFHQPAIPPEQHQVHNVLATEPTLPARLIGPPLKVQEILGAGVRPNQGDHRSPPRLSSKILSTTITKGVLPPNQRSRSRSSTITILLFRVGRESIRVS